MSKIILKIKLFIEEAYIGQVVSNLTSQLIIVDQGKRKLE